MNHLRLVVVQDAALSHPAVKEFCDNNKTSCCTLTVNFSAVPSNKQMLSTDKDKKDCLHLTIDPTDIGLPHFSFVLCLFPVPVHYVMIILTMPYHIFSKSLPN